MKKTLLSFVVMTVVFCMGLTAQVTTSGISGHVTDASGAPVVGAAIVVVHTPSGTEYATVSDVKGQFRLVNLRPGGPYDVKTRMLGFKTVISSGIVIALGETFVIRQTMKEESLDIDAVVITGVQNTIMNSERTGAMTNVSQRQIETMPAGNRSINDFVRLTPQAGNNGTFGARDTRYNNITVDGAQLANRFGLSTTNIMPGGDAQPFSLDAVQEISVSITPFDVRQSNFTGANINAVTKSGTNEFHGSAYGYIKPKTFVGEKIGDNTIRNARQTDKQTFGVTLGGPIVKNKLFFFVTGELEQTTSPGNLWTASVNGKGDDATKTSRASISDLNAISKFFKDEYGYETGSFGGGEDNVSKNHKIVARIDWNISRNHKAMVRYNDVVSTNDQLVNNASSPYSLGNGGRNSIDALSFYNSGYNMENTVRSLTAELNSQFSPTVSNKLLATYTFIQDKRTPFGEMFPFIDIFKTGDSGSMQGYTNLGTELFSVNNVLQNRSFTIFDNVTFALGSHNLTVGASYENEFFSNGYQRQGSTYYKYEWNTSTYATVNDFLNAFKTMKPTGFAYQLPLPGMSDPRNELTFGLASAYVQDEWTVTPKFTLTAGLRMDLPIYITNLQGPTFTEINNTNPNQTIAVKEIKFADGNYYDLGQWPSAKPLFSPRVGFNWDVYGDRSLQIRGGSGIFTGMLPFVWFTNQPGSAGFAQTAETIMKVGDIPANMTFNPDYMAQVFGTGSVLGSAPREGITKMSANFAKVDDDFKLPQVWRTSVAADIDLCYNMVLTLEGMYSKDINAILQKNVNLDFDAAGRYAGPDNRPIIKEQMNGYVNSMTILTNTGKGYQASFTAQLTKNFNNGWAGMIAYTGTIAKDQSANPGSTALSAFTANSTVGDPNNPELSYSGFLAPHRLTGYVSYSVDWLKHLTSTFSVYYSGQHAGRVSYTFSNDMSGGGRTTTKDLIYIPNSKDEMNFVDILNADKIVTYSKEDQATDFEAFIAGNKYLNDRRGQYAERFGDNQPWLNRFDFKFLQDIYSNFGTENRYSLQFSLDILNIGNLINNEWGVYKSNSMQSYENFQVLTFDKRQSDNTYTTKLNAATREDFWKKVTWGPDLKVASTWSIIVGLRLKF